MRSIAVLTLFLSMTPTLAMGQDPKPAATPAAKAPAPATKPDDDTLYALGVAVSQNLKQLNLSPAEVEVVQRGFADALLGRKLQAEPAAQDKKIQDLASARVAATAAANKEAGKAYAAKVGGEKGVQKTASGVLVRAVQEGKGATPKTTDTVKVNIEGKLIDGTVFDSSAKNAPMELAMSQVFPCLSEGLAKVKVGGKAKLVCPAETAFGDRGRPPSVPPGATVVFDVQLVDARPTPAPAGIPGHGGGMMPPGHGGGMMPAGHPPMDTDAKGGAAKAQKKATSSK